MPSYSIETMPGDLKLVRHNHRPVAYARVEEITADVKPGWWVLRLMILQVPAQQVSWILRGEYIDGGEFTMGGEPMCLEAVPGPAPLPESPPEPGPEPEKPKGPKAKDPAEAAKVVSLEARRKGRD